VSALQREVNRQAERENGIQQRLSLAADDWDGKRGRNTQQHLADKAKARDEQDTQCDAFESVTFRGVMR